MTNPFTARREAITAGINQHKEAIATADKRWTADAILVEERRRLGMSAADKRRNEAILEANNEWEETWAAADKECDETLTDLLGRKT